MGLGRSAMSNTDSNTDKERQRSDKASKNNYLGLDIIYRRYPWMGSIHNLDPDASEQVETALKALFSQNEISN